MTSTHRNKNRPVRPVMVIHGPEIFDNGDAAVLMELLAPARTIVAGVMARTAAEESGLPVEFDGRPPSAVIRSTGGPVFLANRGKTPQSGRVFGDIVASRLGDRGLVHIECSDARVYCWNNGNRQLAGDLAAATGYVLEPAESMAAPQEHSRLIRGCIPGEPVYVNGIVIGRATAEIVAIRSRSGQIEPVSGLEPKPHGLEKLGRAADAGIGAAWCKSGAVRSAAARAGGRVAGNGRIIVIDHCGHEIYNRLAGDCCGVLAIGDDTTAVCGHICSHLGIPVLGITDGDRDSILPSAFVSGSIVLDTRPARDDDVGKIIARDVPEGRVCWDEWVRGILAKHASLVTVVLDLSEAAP